MGIYVKGMEMPKRCSACRFAGYGGRFCELHVCMFTGESQPTLSPDRMDNCPLIPVPPHGRLIDKDALEADISASVVFSGRDGNAEIVGAKKIINRLHLAPTIIEAEEASDDLPETVRRHNRLVRYVQA